MSMDHYNEGGFCVERCGAHYDLASGESEEHKPGCRFAEPAVEARS